MPRIESPDLNTPEGFRQYVDRLDDLDSFLGRVETTSRAILKEAGLPDDLKLREHPGEPGRWSGVLELVKDSPGTPRWYAAELLVWIKARRDDLARGDSEGAEYCLAQIMQLRTQAGVSQEMRASGARGGTASRETKAQRAAELKRQVIAMANGELNQPRPPTSRAALARAIASRLNVSPRTIERVLPAKFHLSRK